MKPIFREILSTDMHAGYHHHHSNFNNNNIRTKYPNTKLMEKMLNKFTKQMSEKSSSSWSSSSLSSSQTSYLVSCTYLIIIIFIVINMFIITMTKKPICREILPPDLSSLIDKVRQTNFISSHANNTFSLERSFFSHL